MFFEFCLLVQLVKVNLVLDLGKLVTHVLPGCLAPEAADPEKD